MFVFALWPIISLKNTPFHPLVTGTFYPKLSTSPIKMFSSLWPSKWRHDPVGTSIDEGPKGLKRRKGYSNGNFLIWIESFLIGRIVVVVSFKVTSFYSHQCCCACVVCKWEFTDIPEQATSCRTSHFLSVADDKLNTRFCESPELQNWFLRDNYAFKEA